MGHITLEELRSKANSDYDYQKARLRRHYRYARSKGFSPAEAKILSSHTEEDIERLARESDGEK